MTVLTSDAKDVLMYAYVDLTAAISLWEGRESHEMGVREGELLKAFKLSKDDLEVAFPFLKEEDNGCTNG